MPQYKEKLSKLIEQLIAQGASDLHLGTGVQPVIRVSGVLTPIIAEQPLTAEDMLGYADVLMPEHKSDFLRRKKSIFHMHTATRRASAAMDFLNAAVWPSRCASSRAHPHYPELNLPPSSRTLQRASKGFFLVVGPVGQGKTTTLAALIEKINSERTEHIITIEDPIEYIFDNKRSLIDQREVRVDTADFQTALRSVFSQDVDVVMIGEMRTPETMATAVTAAETGHLVFSTLHTNNASQTIDRIIDSFPAKQQEQIRIQLAGSLGGDLLAAPGASHCRRAYPRLRAPRCQCRSLTLSARSARTRSKPLSRPVPRMA
jgi:twitching motility protein PilT